MQLCGIGFSFNHMVNTFYPIENNAITNKLLLRYKTRLKSPEQEKSPEQYFKPIKLFIIASMVVFLVSKPLF